ncbi:protein-methionine-sulfoxide reductase catalytic subunit MsrP [Jeongeupia sp. HS-3]|uniref:protein-methionine-sulfoxide reductase catalytic subunit MsrP n=1 Tax=Jeongeupia sp. HS-3 TaxID=1009682 RepID=UPI0018A453F5|nr:protein-methionine-sulfoxide reductase catalytic subunit MsrP [Jeongeupia sp. HS-3]BCL76873.1 protein-methionine-sulfoxide reductase catalytic subunit MsrP [Jeongeupia sp. HS-3]
MSQASPSLLPSEITAESLYLDRRRFLQATGGLIAAAMLPDAQAAALVTRPSRFSSNEEKNSWAQITSYNNFYEFGTDKGDPARYAGALKTRPWSLRVEGECEAPKTFDIDVLMKLAPLEERIYRMRCVEGWSMVIPWAGYSLSELLKQVRPTSKAKYIEFISLADPKQMPGLSRPVLDWPYTEGLRIDEAMHPLSILCVGLYGKPLPNQDGAPVRLVVPWKYGFKSAKSLVKIVLRETQPATAWNKAVPSEYGFYSNVNPAVDHPRWSQANERRIGDLLRRKTLPFNGYANEVAGLYKGMDLKKHF